MVRPRTISPSPPEMIELGEEMIKWVTQNNPTNLSHWYVLEKGISRRDFKDLYKKCAEFLPYYEQAMALIGKRYLECEGINPGIAQRWQRIYFPDLMDQENEDASFNAKIKAEADKEALINATPQQQAQLQLLLNVMSQAQATSALSKDNSKSNNV